MERAPLAGVAVGAVSYGAQVGPSEQPGSLLPLRDESSGRPLRAASGRRIAGGLSAGDVGADAVLTLLGAGTGSVLLPLVSA